MDAVVVRYQTRPDAAEENLRLVAGVFDELNSDDPGGLRYVCLRLADGVTFIHIAITEGDGNVLAKTAAFGDFQQGIRDRVADGPAFNDATVVGSYRFLSP
jgi:hypothetical protein